MLVWWPGCYLMFKNGLSPKNQNSVAVDFSPHGKLWMDRDQAAEVEQTRTIVNGLRAKNPDAPYILAFPQAGGWSHFCDWPLGTRHSWFLRGFIRPADGPALIKSLEQTSAVIVNLYYPQVDPPSSDPATWKIVLVPLWTPAVKSAFQQHLGPPIRIDDYCWVFPIKK